VNHERIRTLLVEDEPSAVRLIQETLAEAKAVGFELTHVDHLSDALKLLGREDFDVVLLDLSLPDSQGLEALVKAQAQSPGVPIVILTSLDDETVALKAVQEGAQDYLVKGPLANALLVRSVRYAIERKRLEEQLLHSQKMESLGRLAGGVAHDINNLLTPILGYAQLGTMELPADHPALSCLQEIQVNAQRAATFTRQLLAFSRRQVVELKVISLNDLILDADKMLRRLIGEDIELVTLPASRLGLVKVDPGQMEQVLMNLAVNARDAMPNGGKLTIKTGDVTVAQSTARRHPQVPAGEYVTLTVSDTGVGMTEETKTHLFEPFFTTKEKGKGTGLGLSTCYGIIRQHGGFISISSELGHGTNVQVYLPRAESGSTPQHQPSETGQLPRGKETILLVEDEPAVRELVARVLRNQGYTLLQAANGDEGLRVARQHGPQKIHLLLTDVVMPLMGGTELAQRMRALNPQAKVLFTSGYTDDTLLHHGVPESGMEFLQKPFTPSALARKVRAVLDSPRTANGPSL